ncbi:HAD-IA family hydrolase [Marinibacterium sp. SX1]|uniref:HAD-IA family hydrolase n=1 Tax=Marinibacterium sp. SX1 TaxID=3388424 RepID=UPI003D18747B
MFDLLTALIDSWSLWDSVAGSPERGREWRGRYLELTYGAGTYRPYEEIVAEAARDVGLEDAVAPELAQRWQELEPWAEASEVLTSLAGKARLAVVTNCSRTLGHQAATQMFDNFSVVITAEEAGCYKPARRPYAMTLDALGVPAERTLFVAGSPSDVPGASALGMPVYWHNRIGLPGRGDAVPNYHERSLHRLVDLV